MKNLSTSFALVFAFLCGGGTSMRGMTWSPGWTMSATADGRIVSAAELALARQLGDAIDSPQSARKAILAWEAIAVAQPDEPAAWIELASLRLLEGAAFRSTAKERLICYIGALQASERAMATNPEFLRRVRAGQPVTEAASVLGLRDIEAMHFWATGVFYIFRDCLGLFGRIFNAWQMEGAKTMLQHMDALDSSWEQHTSTFSWGIYYLAMPKSRGGDRERARVCFDRSVAMGENRTLPRWGRGKYFYPAMGDTAAAQADMAAVNARDLDELSGNRSWNRYFKRDAARLLAR